MLPRMFQRACTPDRHACTLALVCVPIRLAFTEQGELCCYKYEQGAEECTVVGVHARGDCLCKGMHDSTPGDLLGYCRAFPCANQAVWSKT